MNDYDERGAIARMVESERARPDQPPPAIVVSDRGGHWFYAFCYLHQRRIGLGETRDRDAAQRVANAHNAEHAE